MQYTYVWKMELRSIKWLFGTAGTSIWFTGQHIMRRHMITAGPHTVRRDMGKLPGSKFVLVKHFLLFFFSHDEERDDNSLLPRDRRACTPPILLFYASQIVETNVADIIRLITTRYIKYCILILSQLLHLRIQPHQTEDPD